ncbi:MAG: ATP-binding protein [Bacteroidia bacterium]|nr:ATP-binding protein [Bacteroidia bacterium]
MIPRTYLQSLIEEIQSNRKIIILFGPRQVGKTTLAGEVLKNLSLKSLKINADQTRFVNILGSRDLEKMLTLVEGFELLFIDEAQRIPDIGINLKILHDNLPNLKILVTGSSAFELANRTREALTGRTLTYILYPISVKELRTLSSPFQLQEQVENYLIYGMYPEIISLKNNQKKVRYLRELVSAYLYKDILELANLKHADKLTNLLKLIAFQVGSQVSLTELGQQLGMAKETVESYLDLLEKSFVIFRLRGFSRNLRKEVTKMSKYYFYDLGVRNAVIENFNPLYLRNDMGQLWENFLLIERRKKQAYEFSAANRYFWRTYTQQEIDYVEESGGNLAGYGFKYTKARVSPPQSWTEAYPQATFEVISPENFLNFII